MDFKSILLAQKTGYIPRNHFDALFARRTGGAVLKDFPGLPASIVTVTDAIAKPLNSLKVAITPVQSGSGDPSPENIRPISGWTGCNVTRCGVNLFDKDAYTVGNVTFKDARNNSSTRSGIKIVLPQGVYIFKCFSETVYNYTYVYKNNNERYVADYKLSTEPRLGWQTQVITVDAGDELFVVRAGGGSAILHLNINLEIVAGNEEPTSYEPYTGQDYPIPFPSEAGTVYGGTLDVVNGVLTVDRKQLNTKNTNWSMYNGVFYTTSSSIRTNPSVRPIAEQYVTGLNADGLGTTSGWGNYSIRQSTGGSSIYIKDSRFSSPSNFKTNANINFVHSLATPITYQLTPTEVQMLLGTNNLWADTGDILEGKYWGKRSSETRAMMNTLRDAGEVTEITPEEPEELEEPEENDER